MEKRSGNFKDKILKITSPNTQYATTFCSASLRKISSIFSRGKLPMVAIYTTGKHRILPKRYVK
jgi:hypothetical protein